MLIKTGHYSGISPSFVVSLIAPPFREKGYPEISSKVQIDVSSKESSQWWLSKSDPSPPGRFAGIGGREIGEQETGTL